MFTAWDAGSRGVAAGLGRTVATALFVTGQHSIRRFALRAHCWDRLPGIPQGAVLALLIVGICLFQVGEVDFIYFQF